jgi:Protein of unknown function (DUF664)
MNEKSSKNDVITGPDLDPDPPRAAPERDMLVSFLDYFRSVLVRKASGLTPDQLDVALPPSTLTLGRLLRHMSLVEDHWFGYVLHGREYHADWTAADWEAQPDWEMDTAGDFSPTELAAQFHAAVDRSRSAIDGFDLDRVAVRLGRFGATSLRWILIHMIEEYARHCGHADMLRESIDGQVGD